MTTLSRRQLLTTASAAVASAMAPVNLKEPTPFEGEDIIWSASPSTFIYSMFVVYPDTNR